MPGRADLTARDRVRIDGDVWRVDGEPAYRVGVASGAYTVATLRRIVGEGVTVA